MSMVLIASFLALSGTPAAATSQPSAANTQHAQAAKPAEKKYCLTIDRVTGSRVEKVQCKTKRQWAWEGVNIDQLTN